MTRSTNARRSTAETRTDERRTAAICPLEIPLAPADPAQGLGQPCRASAHAVGSGGPEPSSGWWPEHGEEVPVTDEAR